MNPSLINDGRTPYRIETEEIDPFQVDEELWRAQPVASPLGSRRPSASTFLSPTRRNSIHNAFAPIPSSSSFPVFTGEYPSVFGADPLAFQLSGYGTRFAADPSQSYIFGQPPSPLALLVSQSGGPHYARHSFSNPPDQGNGYPLGNPARSFLDPQASFAQFGSPPISTPGHQPSFSFASSQVTPSAPSPELLYAPLRRPSLFADYMGETNIWGSAPLGSITETPIGPRAGPSVGFEKSKGIRGAESHPESQLTPLSLARLSLACTYFTRDVYDRVHVTGLELEPAKGMTLPKFPNPATTAKGTPVMILVEFKAGRVDVFHIPGGYNPGLSPGGDGPSRGSALAVSPTGEVVSVEAIPGKPAGALGGHGGGARDPTGERKLLGKPPQSLGASVAPWPRGTLLVVEADRGKDLGKLVCEITLEEARALKLRQHQEQQAALSVENNNVEPTALPVLHYPKPLLRPATAKEVVQILTKQADEIKAKRVCQMKVHQHNLPMVIIDSEYQWDYRKLTFYYQASHRIDFRDLVRELFRIYKTRIWMCAVIEYDRLVDLVNGDLPLITD